MTVLVDWGAVAEKARVADADNVDDSGVANEDCRSEEEQQEEEEVVDERREARAMRGRADDEGNNVGGMMVSFICVGSPLQVQKCRKEKKKKIENESLQGLMTRPLAKGL